MSHDARPERERPERGGGPPDAASASAGADGEAGAASVATEAERVARAAMAWPRLSLVRPVQAASPGPAWLGRQGTERVLVRRSPRRLDALAWELDLLDHLAQVGLRVPAARPAGDGRRQVDGVVVSAWLDGREPTSAAEWDAVLAALARVHEATADWSQRPGAVTAVELLARRRTELADLDALPAEALGPVEAALEALAAAQDGERAVVHGAARATTVRMVGSTVALLGWDEARVDQPALDRALLTVPPSRAPRAVVRRAALAYRIAARWPHDEAEGRRLLSELLGT